MRYKNSFKKLSQAGVLHHIVPIVVFLLLFGVTGTYLLLLRGNAAPIKLAGTTITSGLGSKICLDDYKNKLASGSTVDIWACNNSAAQTWTVVDSGTYSGTIQDHGLCLAPKGGSQSNNAPVQLITCKKSTNGKTAVAYEQWNDRSGFLYNGTSSKCLDVTKASTKNGTIVELYTCNNGKNQKWTFSGGNAPTPTPPGGGSGGGGAAGAGAVTSGVSGLCLDDKGNATAANSPVTVATCNGSAQQDWTVSVSNGTEAPNPQVLKINGKCLTVLGNVTTGGLSAGEANGDSVVLNSCSGANTQFWSVRPSVAEASGSNPNPTPSGLGNELEDLGSFDDSGLCLADPNSGGSGTALQVSPCNGKIQQVWDLSAATSN